MGRVLRRLSRPLKIRGFLVGLGRCDAKVMGLSLCHILLQIRLHGTFLTSFLGGCNSAAKVFREHLDGQLVRVRNQPSAQRQIPAMKT